MIKRTIRRKNQITLPAPVLKALGVGQDDEIGFDIGADNTVTIVALTTIPSGDLIQVQGPMAKVGQEVPAA